MKYCNKTINCYNIPLFHVDSDASNTGIACIFDVRVKKKNCYRNLTDLEKTFSSTWRELEAIQFSLVSSIKQFESKCIFWYTDNFATQQIVKCGSNKTHIHSLALDIFNLTFDHNIHSEVFYWPQAPFWPLLASGHDTYFPFVKDVHLTENPAACIKLGNNEKSILGSPAYQGYFIAILMMK